MNVFESFIKQAGPIQNRPVRKFYKEYLKHFLEFGEENDPLTEFQFATKLSQMGYKKTQFACERNEVFYNARLEEKRRKELASRKMPKEAVILKLLREFKNAVVHKRDAALIEHIKAHYPEATFKQAQAFCVENVLIVEVN